MAKRGKLSPCADGGSVNQETSGRPKVPFYSNAHCKSLVRQALPSKRWFSERACLRTTFVRFSVRRRMLVPASIFDSHGRYCAASKR